MTPYKPFNPSVSLRTHQPHMTPLDPSGPPQDQLRTTTGPLNTPSVLLGPLRTLQVPSGPLRIPYYDFINLLKNIILCRKMLVFNLSALHSLTNISVQILPRNKIDDSLKIYIDRAVQKYIKLLLYLPRKPRNKKIKSGNCFVRHPVSIKTPIPCLALQERMAQLDYEAICCHNNGEIPCKESIQGCPQTKILCHFYFSDTCQ